MKGTSAFVTRTIFTHSNFTRKTPFIFNRVQQTLFALRYFHERKIDRDLHKESVIKISSIHAGTFLYIVFKMKFYMRMTSAPVERTAFSPLFLREFYFFPGWSAHLRQKKIRDSKVDFCTSWWQIDDRLCGLSQRARDRSVTSVCPPMSFWQRDSQNCAFARFRSPRLFIEAMQFTDKRVYARAEKKNNKHMHTCAHFAPGRHGVNWIFKPALFGDFS